MWQRSLDETLKGRKGIKIFIGDTAPGSRIKLCSNNRLTYLPYVAFRGDRNFYFVKINQEINFFTIITFSYGMNLMVKVKRLWNPS